MSDSPISDEQAAAALQDGTIRIGCTRGMDVNQIPPDTLVAIARQILELERQPPSPPPTAEAWTGDTSKADDQAGSNGFSNPRSRRWRRRTPKLFHR